MAHVRMMEFPPGSGEFFPSVEAQDAFPGQEDFPVRVGDLDAYPAIPGDCFACAVSVALKASGWAAECGTGKTVVHALQRPTRGPYVGQWIVVRYRIPDTTRRQIEQFDATAHWQGSRQIRLLPPSWRRPEKKNSDRANWPSTINRKRYPRGKGTRQPLAHRRDMSGLIHTKQKEA